MSRVPRRCRIRLGQRKEIVRCGAVLTLILGLTVAHFSPSRAVAQIRGLDEADRSADQSVTRPIAAFIPPKPLGVITIRPHDILSAPTAKPLKSFVEAMTSRKGNAAIETLRAAGIVPTKIEAIVIVLMPPGEGKVGDAPQPALAIRLTEPVNQDAIAKAGQTSAAEGGTIYKVDGLGRVLIPDQRTVLIAPAGNTGTPQANLLQKMVSQSQINRGLSRLARIGEPELGVLVDANAVDAIIQKALNDHPNDQPPPAAKQAIAMLRDLQWAGLAVRLGESPNIVALAKTTQRPAAQQLAGKLRELVSTGQEKVRQFQQRMTKPAENQEPSGLQGKKQAAQTRLFSLAENVLNSVKIETRGTFVTLTADTGNNGTFAIAGALLLPAIQQAREAARRAQSQNHLKQLGLSFHNYHAKHGYFPPAVIEKNGVPHSWRVAILPFLEQNDLYEQYRFDEPWDSEHNKKLIPKMPKFFRDPSDHSNANSASYYLLTSDKPVAKFGKESLTLFTDKPINLTAGGRGPKLSDITDGTANTILIVEASRNIPWTKPEDIPFNPENVKELPQELGGNHPGGFLATTADGSVHFISEPIGSATLKWLITPADGNVLNLPN